MTAEFEKVLDYKVDYEEFVAKLRDYITIPLKISLLGFGGVGKTTFATLLSGGTPPIKYEPTVTFGLFKLKGIRFGTYQVVIWDLAGQEIFHKLWSLYLRDSRVVFLITDSTVGNVLESKKLVEFIRRERLDVKMRAIANKQDLVGAMSPKLVERILGIKAEGMVAIDVRNRQKAIDLIRKALEDLDEDEDTDYEVDLE